MNYLEVFQGDITPVILERPNVLANGSLIDGSWICKISALDSTGSVTVAVRTITEKATKNIKTKDGSYSDEECFLCYLLPSETETLTEDDENTNHKLIIEVSNVSITPVFNIEDHYILHVKKQGI